MDCAEFHSDQEPKTATFQGSSSSMRARKRRHVSEELFVSEGSEHGTPQEQQHQSMNLGVTKDQSVNDGSGDRALKPSDQDIKFERLWKLYQTASGEYCKTRKNTMSRTRAAKFLRDTTENCVLYIEDKQRTSNSQTYEKSKLRELRATLEEAIKEVEKGSGGKKRRFDDDWDDVPMAPRQLLGNHPVESSDQPAPSQHAHESPMKILPPPRGSYNHRYKGLKTAPISRYKEQHLSQVNRRRLSSLGQDAHGPPMRTLPPPPGSYSQGRPRIASNDRYYNQHPSQFNRRRSASPIQNAPKPPRQTLPPRHDSYDGPKGASSSQYHEQRLSQFSRRRSASPDRYPDAPRQVSRSEQSRDRRRQDILPGYYDTYRPHY